MCNSTTTTPSPTPHGQISSTLWTKAPGIVLFILWWSIFSTSLGCPSTSCTLFFFFLYQSRWSYSCTGLITCARCSSKVFLSLACPANAVLSREAVSSRTRMPVPRLEKFYTEESQKFQGPSEFQIKNTLKRGHSDSS